MNKLNKHNFVQKLFDLQNKTIVITGGTGLLGPEFATVLSSVGAHVVLVGKTSKNQKFITDLKKTYNTNPSYITVDITKKDEVKQLANFVLQKYGRIDGLVNNAQFVPRDHPDRSSSFEIYSEEFWNETLDTNLTGPFFCSQQIGKIMKKQKQGVIVNVSSIYGMVGADQRIYGKTKLNSPPSYAATKGAILNLTRYMAAYWQNQNIRVNSLTLGGVYNKQDSEFVKRYSAKTMLGRMATKQEYSGALLFLLSDASSYMTGANLVLDGGWTAW